MKALFIPIGGADTNGPDLYWCMYDNSNNLVGAPFGITLTLGTDMTPTTPGATLLATIASKVIAAAAAMGYTITASDIVWNGYSPYTPAQLAGSGFLNIPTVNNAPGRSLVTTAAAANGYQISSTRPVWVSYSITITSTATLSGNQAGYVVLEICPTNSSTAADWIEISRVSNGQSIALALAITSTAIGGGANTGMIPAGYFVRQRQVSSTGTPSFATNGQQESVL